MAINANVLSFVAGAAEQFTQSKDEFKKELRENKRRQRDWMNTYGNKIVSDSSQKQEVVTAALKELESRGLQQPDVIQLLQKHGVDAVLDLQKYVKEYEDRSGSRVDSDLINKVWQAADDFTSTSKTYGDAVKKVFGSSKAGAATPVIQEAEERSFFDKLKANLSGAYEDEEYADFLDDPTEGIGDQSINDLRRMAAASPSMLGTDGAAVFDRTQLRGDEPTAGESRLWKNTTIKTIVRNALNRLPAEDRDAVEKRDSDSAPSGFTIRNAEDIFFDLADPRSVYFDAFSEATREVHTATPFSNNRAATGAYGGQEALNNILIPPEPLTLKELAEQLELDLIDNNLTGARPEDIGEKTDVELGEWFRDNEKDFVISNGVLIGRPDDAPFDESKVVTPVEAEVTEAQEAQTARLETAENIISPERPELSGRSGSREYSESLRKRGAFDAANKDKYELDGTAILAPMYPNSEAEAKLLVEPPWNFKVKGEEGTKEPSAGDSIRKPSQIIEDLRDKTLEDFQEEWNTRYKETHDPLTGFPLGAKFTESAEADE